MTRLKTPDIRPVADAIIAAALRAADPADAVRRNWPEDLDSAPRVILLAAGKGAAPMVEAAAERLGRRITRGAVACVPEHESRVRAALEQAGAGPVSVHPADHPLPTLRNLGAAKALADAAGLANEQDQVLALVSGGASAHLCMPAEGIALDDLRALSNAIMRAGATIRELNSVRKHAERLKGGGLARLCWPAPTTVLVLSDVLGDPLDTIGSGPFAGDEASFADALRVLDRHDLRRVSPSITAHLVRGTRGEETETPGPSDPILERTQHTVIANNALSVESVTRAAIDLGFRVDGVERNVVGPASEVGLALGHRTARLARAGGRGSRCFVLGGETTVQVGDATGKGGPCTELALASAFELEGLHRAAVVTLATDGIDGPTDAAGAIATGSTLEEARAAGIDPRVALTNHDSYTLFGSVDALVRTGPTGTNVNDIAIGLVFG